MKGLAELVVSLCDLCEAEGRLLEAGILRTVRRVALLSLGLLFVAAALALLLAALYALLASLLSTPATLALLGAASAAIAVLLLWSARGGAARDGGVSEPEKKRMKAGPVETASAQKPVGTAASKPATVQPPAERHAPWARVAPYGHGAATDTSPKAGKGGLPKGDAGKQEKR